MSEFLENNKIGFGLQSRDISKTKKLLKKFNINNLKSNVKKFYESNSMWKKGDNLKNFYFSFIN